MLPVTVKLFVTLTLFTIMLYLTTEAADTCPATTASCIPGLPGRDGRDGQPGRDWTPGRDGTPGCNGRDGAPGPPSALNDTEKESMKKDIMNALREEVCQLNRLSSCKPTCNGMCADNPAASCKEIYDCNPSTPSGNYWISTDSGPQEVYCEMRASRCGNITGGWMRVAHINMSDPEQTCPSPLRTLTSPLRMCAGGTSAGCSSVQYPTLGLNFTHVCGQAIGYMYHSADGLDAPYTSKTIDSPYVDGLSITYGSPRHHLWTYAAGACLDAFAKPTIAPRPHHPLLVSTTIVTGGQNDTPLPGTPSTPSGTVRAVLLATPAVTHPTCRGSTGHSAQPPLMTLKCVGAVMKQPAMKMLE